MKALKPETIRLLESIAAHEHLTEDDVKMVAMLIASCKSRSNT